jgi:hypothetical protein
MIRDAVRYEFNQRDRDRDRYWPCPIRLAEYLRQMDPVAISALAVLVFFAFPGRTKGAAISHSQLPCESPAWTPWAVISLRWLGTLSGCSRNSAARALKCLVGLNLVQTFLIPGLNGRGGTVTVVRLSFKCFAQPGEAMVQIPGSLIFSGSWMLLPANVHRATLLAIAMLSEVRNPLAFAQALETSRTPDWDDVIDERRKKSHVSLGAIQSVTGYSRRSTIDAISVLAKPIFGKADKFGFVEQSKVAGDANGYWINPKAFDWHFSLDAVNRPAREIEALRKSIWS